MRAVVGLAKELDLKVIAEGAETQEEIARLKELECRYAQGFAFSKPVTGPEMVQLIKRKSKQSAVAKVE